MRQLDVHLLIKVMQHMKWTKEKAVLWFMTENPHCGGMTPADFVERRPAKARKWLLALIEENSPPVDTSRS